MEETELDAKEGGVPGALKMVVVPSSLVIWASQLLQWQAGFAT